MKKSNTPRKQAPEKAENGTQAAASPENHEIDEHNEENEEFITDGEIMVFRLILAN